MTAPVTLITGASAGLGAEFARQCAARGEPLLLVARRRERLEALAAQLGGTAHVIAADLEAHDAAQALAAEVAARGLEVGTLINNAGFGLAGRIAALSPERQRAMIDLNIGTLTDLSRLFAPQMVSRGRGGILNVASTAAFQAGPNMGVYYATKAYVLSFSEALHHELKGTGVRVSCLCPGPTATEFFQAAGMKGKIFERMAADAPSVVRAGLKGLDRNQAVVVPGVMNKVGAQSGRILPRALLRRIVGAIKV